jgi:hypothetical protein
MKDQSQQPSNPNGTARGAGSGIGSLGAGFGSAASDPTARGATSGIGGIGAGFGGSAPDFGSNAGLLGASAQPDGQQQQQGGQPLYDWQRSSGPAAPTGFGSNANDSFAAQGFSGVSGQPPPSPAAGMGLVGGNPGQPDSSGYASGTNQANPSARGAMNYPGGQPLTPSASGAPFGANAVAGGNQSFADQGFSGVSGQPAPNSRGAPSPAANMGATNGQMVNPRMMYAGQNNGSGITAPGQPAGNPAPRDPTAPMNTDPAQYGPTSGSVDTSNVPGLVGGDSLGRMTQDSRDAAYRQATGYLDPQWNNEQNALETQLANQGVMQNSEAWNKAIDDFGRRKTFAYQQAQDAAVGQGNAAQAQMFGQGLAANTNQFGQNTVQTQIRNALQGQLANQGFAQQGITNGEAQRRFDNSLTSRNQGINELLLQQKNPLEMYNALTNGTNVTQPNFTNATGANVGGTDLLTAIQQAYGGKLNAYNAQTGAANSSNAGIAAIIAALIGG